MKSSPIFLAAAILFCSCKEVTFRQPQPNGRKPLTSVPEKLRGRYLTFQENGALSQDTIVVTRYGYRFGYFNKVVDSGRENYDARVLSDSLILKSYKGYYFLNFYEDPEWLLRVVKQEKNGDLVYMAMEQDGVDFNDYIRKLSSELPIDSVSRNNETLYYIDPSPSKLVELIEKSYFSRATLKKIE
jgi:hypothetical protein